MTSTPAVEETVAAAADDFGHLVRRRPRAVVAPRSPAEVAAAVRAAGAAGHRVAARGRGHSVYGRAQVADGVVVSTTHLRAVHPVDGRRVVVEAGASWGEVLAATLPHGLAPAVFPGYLDLSVGGTVAVGGVGATSWRDGAVADHVVALDVVTGTGDELTCSPDHHPELFDAVRAGLGQVALVTRATLALSPAPERVRRCTLRYPDVPTLLADQRLLAADGRFAGQQGAAVRTPGGWAFRLEAVAWLDGPGDDALLHGLADRRPDADLSTVPYADELDRLAAFERLLRGNGQWFHPHPWLTAFVPDAVAEGLVEAELDALGPADLGPFGQVVLAPVDRRPMTAPLLRLPAGDRAFAVNVIRVPATGGPADRMVAANRAAYERLRAAGGVLYPASAAVPMTPDDWRAHFGPAWAAFAAARRRYDPAGLLTPGYGIF